ncbi:hypothetical protein AUJ84_03665 [Candidatus Pacearchaeota archaeon CG1_02_32_132]|nr:MAG: hypothetical protein AUJ84_03665 [Candidatus Pacearchaeota archaeon CG1_02_32_132]
MVKSITYAPIFQRKFKKIDKSYSEGIKKLIKKIIENPEIGKPMQYERKDTREVYLSPFRLSYSYDIKTDVLTLLNIYHKDEQ